jgi:exodeoxyribonuclease V alpha subunit
MITRNDYGMGLYNGDIGITMRSKDDGTLKVYFEMPDGEIKGFLTCRIPEHETTFAMTIHKSQGSEFNQTFMVLPADYTPLITRELVYTGVTRAKQSLSLYSTESTLDLGVRIKTERISGLANSLI